MRASSPPGTARRETRPSAGTAETARPSGRVRMVPQEPAGRAEEREPHPEQREAGLSFSFPRTRSPSSATKKPASMRRAAGRMIFRGISLSPEPPAAKSARESRPVSGVKRKAVYGWPVTLFRAEDVSGHSSVRLKGACSAFPARSARRERTQAAARLAVTVNSAAARFALAVSRQSSAMTAIPEQVTSRQTAARSVSGMLMEQPP